jgi:hypothetical protein
MHQIVTLLWKSLDNFQCVIILQRFLNFLNKNIKRLTDVNVAVSFLQVDKTFAEKPTLTSEQASHQL